MAGQPSVRLDLRAVLPAAALAVVVLVIVFVELCGREDVEPYAQSTPFPEVPTATPAPTFTPGPSPTGGGEEPTATEAQVQPGGEERDTARVLDLDAIRDALEQYRQEQGEYPDSGGNVQTLCVFPEFDKGCELKDVLDPLPIDPLGEPITENGYWYSGTGDEYAVFAQRESDLFPECPEHPAFLRQFDTILCVQGPSATPSP